MDAERSISLEWNLGDNDLVFDGLSRIRDAWPFLDSLEDAVAYAVGWAIAKGICEEGANVE